MVEFEVSQAPEARFVKLRKVYLEEPNFNFEKIQS